MIDVRDATALDAPAISALLAELGFTASADEIGVRLKLLRVAGEPPLVADADGVLGCLTWHVTPALHRPTSVGRITMLIVTASARGRGVGKALVGAAETRLLSRGCGLVEVTSNLRLPQAHSFYQHLGYAHTSHRFAKELGPALRALS